MSLQGWETLQCVQCQGTQFVTVVQLIYRDGQGTTNKPYGYKCADCGRQADTGALVSAAKRAIVAQKIKDLESESANG